jgi:RNA polymerase sigma factor (sigma-70 family)
MDNSYSNSRRPARLVLTRDVPRRGGDLTDAALVTESVRDPDAFTEVFERHWDDVYRFCLSRAGSAGEDIAAEVFRVAFDRRRRYQSRYSDARPWLFGIASNLLREHFRSARREDNKLQRSGALTHGEADADSLERQLLGPELASALLGIPAADRDALLLLAWADLDYEQIAQALDIPVGTVRSRIHRARERVREYLKASQDHQDRVKEA